MGHHLWYSGAVLMWLVLLSKEDQDILPDDLWSKAILSGIGSLHGLLWFVAAVEVFI